jgi:hypothetical protein
MINKSHVFNCMDYVAQNEVGMTSFKTLSCHFLGALDSFDHCPENFQIIYLISGHSMSDWMLKTKLNSVALVRERTIPTGRPPLVAEVCANFCG